MAKSKAEIEKTEKDNGIVLVEFPAVAEILPKIDVAGALAKVRISAPPTGVISEAAVLDILHRGEGELVFGKVPLTDPETGKQYVKLAGVKYHQGDRISAEEVLAFPGWEKMVPLGYWVAAPRYDAHSKRMVMAKYELDVLEPLIIKYEEFRKAERNLIATFCDHEAKAIDARMKTNELREKDDSIVAELMDAFANAPE